MQLSQYIMGKHAALAETDVTTTPANAAYDAERMSLDRALGIALSGDAAHASMGEDHLGTGRFVYNQAKTQTAAFEHYPYGARYTASGTAPYHEFTGKPWDPDATLYYFPYRYLRPDMARWTSADPTGLYGGTNVYAYIRDNPTKFYDSLGLWPTKQCMLDCMTYEGGCLAGPITCAASFLCCFFVPPPFNVPCCLASTTCGFLLVAVLTYCPIACSDGNPWNGPSCTDPPSDCK